MKLIAVVAVSAALALAGCRTGSSTKNHDPRMSGMNHGSSGMKMSDSSLMADMKSMNQMMVTSLQTAGEKHDEKFINMMLEHHHGAVMMAEEALDSAQREEIRRMSRQIIDAQKKEIAQLKSWRMEWYGY